MPIFHLSGTFRYGTSTDPFDDVIVTESFDVLAATEGEALLRLPAVALAAYAAEEDVPIVHFAIITKEQAALERRAGRNPAPPLPQTLREGETT